MAPSPVLTQPTALCSYDPNGRFHRSRYLRILCRSREWKAGDGHDRYLRSAAHRRHARTFHVSARGLRPSRHVRSLSEESNDIVSPFFSFRALRRCSAAAPTLYELQCSRFSLPSPNLASVTVQRRLSLRQHLLDRRTSMTAFSCVALSAIVPKIPKRPLLRSATADDRLPVESELAWPLR